mgnify:CR=1 FL=1
MSLRKKCFFILTVVITLYATIDYSIQRSFIFNSYLALEKQEAEKDLNRTLSSLKREIHHLNAFTYDWAAWDDTYSFIQDRNAAYIESNLQLPSFVENELSLISYIDQQGNVVWSKAIDRETRSALSIKEFEGKISSRDHLLIAHSSTDSHISGLYLSSIGPLLIATRPIITSELEGPVRGTLIMAKQLNAKFIQTLQEQTRVPLHIWSINDPAIPTDDRKSLALLSPDTPALIHEHSSDEIHVYTFFPDYRNRPALLVRIDVARNISRRGSESIRFTLLSSLGAGLLILIVFLILLSRTVISPIEKFTSHVTNIANNDRLHEKLSVKSNDEIGYLAREFNSMTGQLADAHEKLMQKSYFSGMAEIAAGIMHNIGNTLNPASVNVSLILKYQHEFPLTNIKTALQELTAPDLNPERREKLHEYLRMAIDHLEELFADNDAKLQDVYDRFTLIETILTDHRNFSRADKLVEEFHPAELIQEAVMLLPLTSEIDIKIVQDPSLGQLKTIKNQKISLKHIVMNVLVNAVESIHSTGRDDGKITIRGEMLAVQSHEFMHLEICDNGIGLTTEEVDKIFDREYSTKKRQNTGFGLHWCANTIIALGGKIMAEPDETTGGVCIHLLIPRETIL